jgi:hypothetical protein
LKEEFKKLSLKKENNPKFNLDLYKNKIKSQIDGQDQSSQLWIRETVQNSVDAIKSYS